MKMLTVKDVMDRLGFRKPDVVYALIRDRQLAAYRHVRRGGGKPAWRIAESDLSAYLDGIRVDVQAPERKPPARPAGGMGRLRRSLLNPSAN